MRRFCTYFDAGYLTRGYALYASLARHCASFELSVLCLDSETHNTLTAMALPHLKIIPLAALESHDPDLVSVKHTRSRVEYYMSCTAALASYIVATEPSIDQLTYIDADFFFFSDVEPVFEQIGGASIAITAHKFVPSHSYLERLYGRYNCGWLTLRNDPVGRSCLARWREQCIAWCYDRTEPNRYADQMYLDEWPDRYPDTLVLGMKGVNLAPFNVGNYHIGVLDGGVSVDEDRLVCYHFAGLKDLGGVLYYLSVANYGGQASRVLIEEVYEPYFQALKEARRVLTSGRGFRLRRVSNILSALRSAAGAIAKRRFLIFVGNRVLLKSVVCSEQ